MERRSVGVLGREQETQRGEAATDRSAPVPGRSNVGSLAVWGHSRASSQASLAAAGTAALLREFHRSLRTISTIAVQRPRGATLAARMANLFGKDV
jgi:hypothetical protein